jgi:hypothetical protein
MIMTEIKMLHRPGLHPARRGFARSAGIAEIFNFSFAVERTAKENYSAALLQKIITHLLITIVEQSLNPEGLMVLAIKRLSEKLKNKKPTALCGEEIIVPATGSPEACGKPYSPPATLRQGLW